MITDIFKKKKITLELLIFLLVMVLISAASLWIHSNYPLSDAAFYSLVTEHIVKTGDFPLAIDKLPSDGKGFPITYPGIFFVTNAISFLTIGDIFPLKFISYIFFVLFLYLFLKNIFKLSKVSCLLTVFFISTNYQILYYFFIHQKQEFFLFPFFITIGYFLLKDKKLNYKNLILLSIFSSFIIGIKQISYPFVLLVCLFVIFNRKIIINRKIIFFVLIILFSLPILMELFLRTGTILYPDGLPKPFSSMEKGISSLFGVEMVASNEEFIAFTSKTLTQETRVASRWDNWFFILFGSKVSIIYTKIFLIFLLLGGFYFLFRFNPRFFILPLLVLVYSLAFFKISPIPQYFVFIPVFTLSALAFLLYPFYCKLNKNLKIIFCGTLFLLIFFGAFSNIQTLHNVKIRSIQQAHALSVELDAAGAILSPRTYELALYQNREVYWFHLYGNWNLFEILSRYNPEKLKNYMLENNITYIFIPKYIISRLPFERAWPGHVSIDLVNNLKKDDNFIIYKEDSNVLIFKLNNNE
jgi:hypothetical protein